MLALMFSWLHSSCVVSPPQNLFFRALDRYIDTSSIPSRHFLNTSSIQAFLSRFLGFSQYLLIDSPTHRAKFFGVIVCSIASQYLPRSIKNFCRRHLLNTSRSIKLLFSIKARCLLDLSSCVFYI